MWSSIVVVIVGEKKEKTKEKGKNPTRKRSDECIII